MPVLVAGLTLIGFDMRINNLVRYVPTPKDESEHGAEAYNTELMLAVSLGVVWYKDSTGTDFYESRNSWPNNGKWKLAFGADGRVFSYSKDILDIIVHEGTSIVECDELPKNFDSHGFWYIVGNKLVENIQLSQAATRSLLLSKLDSRISVLQNRVDDGDAQDKHVEELANRRSQRSYLRNIDITLPVESWPDIGGL